jgi:hypothetical protein
MNKKIIVVLVVVAILGLTSVVVINNKSASNGNVKSAQTQNSPEQNNSSTQVSNYKSACDVFTLDIAKKYLGNDAKLGDTASSNSTTHGEDIVNSSCLYDAGGDSLESRNIGLITAKNSNGENWIKTTYKTSPNETAEITESEPPKLTQMSGLGDEAYWNPQLGSLNIIMQNGKYWLTVQGSIRDKQAEIELHKNMAQEIINNL